MNNLHNYNITALFKKRGLSIQQMHIPVGPLLAATLALASAGTASAQLTWDDSRKNPYVAAGYGDQCTAFAEGRYRSLNGEWLSFENPQGKAVYPNAGLMYAYVTETVTTYRDSVPVRGAVICWKKSGTLGHAATVERISPDGSVDIAEQNWPPGSSPKLRSLTAAQLQRRPSTVNGVTSHYSLAGFINPNRPPALGSLSTTRNNSKLQLDMALLDEDGRSVRVLVALFDGNNVVANTTVNGSVTPNRTVRVTWNSPRLTRGRNYTVRFWAWDWRELRGSKSKTFVW